MAIAEMSSRERMLDTMEFKQTDYIPCSFMLFHALRDRYPGDYYRFLEEQLKLDLDTVVELPELPLTTHPDVYARTWREDGAAGEQYPLLHKQYFTPAGELHTIVRKTEDWPHGDEVKFYDDYNVPRSVKFHINSRPDLKSLRYMLMPPSKTQLEEYRETCVGLKRFAKDRGLLVRGVRGVMMDGAIRFAGVENLVFSAIEDPSYVEEFMDIMANWNMQRMEIVLDEKPDLFFRRGFYENMTFWSPTLFWKFMKPYLEQEIKVVHDAGIKFGYLTSCSYMNLLDDYTSLGFDVLVGADPVEDKEMEPSELKRKLWSKICIWGGANGFVTMEQGTVEDVRKELEEALDVFAPGGGFILSPVDNVRDMSEKTMSNALAFIQAWKEKRHGDYYGKAQKSNQGDDTK